jgi:hypothetical protein
MSRPADTDPIEKPKGANSEGHSPFQFQKRRSNPNGN